MFLFKHPVLKSRETKVRKSLRPRATTWRRASIFRYVKSPHVNLSLAFTIGHCLGICYGSYTLSQAGPQCECASELPGGLVSPLDL